MFIDNILKSITELPFSEIKNRKSSGRSFKKFNL